jgi:hypothetical protein
VTSPLPIRACHRSDEGRTNGVDEEDHYHNSIGRLQVPYSVSQTSMAIGGSGGLASRAALAQTMSHTEACRSGTGST